ncbi:hypothetical protein FACS1894172_14660 [Spirochaetia bacterium]|nr:hypothetical protein FACS1894164_16930 [Spirochaetia bacterium]GHU34427.1 hypothetical protein FACS1894172_14660 [Spirochaetia bacterium]
MKNAAIFFLVFCPMVFWVSCASSSLLLQNDDNSEQSEQTYKISFLAYGPGTPVGETRSIAGHASLSIDGPGVYGFYPDIPGKLISKQGQLKYSTEYPINQLYTDFLVSENTRNKILELIAKWENTPPPFILPANDCVSFIYRVCDVIGLKYDPFILLPTNAIRAIRIFNVHDKVY